MICGHAKVVSSDSIEMSDDKRTISRTFRIPIELDNKVLNRKNELGTEKLTDAYSLLIKLGMDVLEYKDKIQASPEEREKISKELEDNINKLLKHSVSSLRLSEIEDAELEFILSHVASELQSRMQKRAKTDGYKFGIDLSRRIKEESRRERFER